MTPRPDVDIATSDTTKITTRGHIYQVNSSPNNSLYYFNNKDKDTTPIFIICRIFSDLYKPRVKMRCVLMKSRTCALSLPRMSKSEYKGRGSRPCMYLRGTSSIQVKRDGLINSSQRSRSEERRVGKECRL